MSELPEEEFISFVYTPPPPVEFRLYYGEDGKVITYTCEKLEGNYIIVDAQTFAEARPDVQVVDGKVTRIVPKVMISKLKPSTQGTLTYKDDISLIAKEETTETQYWKLTSHELK